MMRKKHAGVGGLRVVRVLLLLPALLGVAVSSDEPVVYGRLPELFDLKATAGEARARRLPILLAFTAQECSYCELVVGSFLEPMHRGGEYRDKVLMREVLVDSGRLVRDPLGEPVTPGALASRYGASLTPTLVFIDADGRRLTRNLVGITNEYFYGGFLDESISEALRKVRAAEPASSL